MRNNSVYRNIAEDLIDKIALGDYKKKSFPSEQQLCLEYSTSRKTVRRALEILEKREILRTVQGKGRKLNSTITNHHTSTNNILCLVFRFATPYAEFNNEVSKLFGELGYTAQILFQNKDYSFDTDFLRQNEFDGLIFVGIRKDDIISNIIKLTNGKPAIVINHNDCLLELDQISTDLYVNTIHGCQYLIDSGHQKIGFIVNKRFPLSLNGIKKCCELNNIKLNDNSLLIVDSGDVPEKDLDKFISKNDFTALYISVYRSNGASVFRYLYQKAINVPEELSVMGYDDVDLELEDKIIKPDCMATQWNKMAEIAVKRLCDKINNKDDFKIRYSINSKLVKRGTVKNLNE